MSIRTITALCVFATSLIAQGPLVNTDHFVGLASRPGIQGAIHDQDILSCITEKVTCPVGVSRPMTTSLSGGTAYDPTRQSVWISDGKELREVQLPSCRSCSVTATLANPANQVSGLAFDPRSSRSTLYQLETRPGWFGIVVYRVLPSPPSCRIVVASRCEARLPNAQDLAGGLAFDKGRQILYVCYSRPVPNGFLWNLCTVVARDPQDCTVQCHLPIPMICGARPRSHATGLAYSGCKDQVYIAGERVIAYVDVRNPSTCNFRVPACCAKRRPESWRGLAVLPGWTVKPISHSCTVPPCAGCPGMVLRTENGDAALGSQFGFRLSSAPKMTHAWCVLAAGNCPNPGTVMPLLWCGGLRPWPGTILAATVSNGAGACNSSARIVFDTPVERSLCGMSVCAQFAIACGGLPLSLSTALEVKLTSL